MSMFISRSFHNVSELKTHKMQIISSFISFSFLDEFVDVEDDDE